MSRQLIELSCTLSHGTEAVRICELQADQACQRAFFLGGGVEGCSRGRFSSPRSVVTPGCGNRRKGRREGIHEGDEKCFEKGCEKGSCSGERAPLRSTSGQLQQGVPSACNLGEP